VRIALNAMQVRAAKSGVGHYIQALLESLLNHSEGNDFTIYCSPQNADNYRFPSSALEVRTWGLPEQARSLRLAYEYAFFPRELAKGGYSLFHGMSNFLPLRKTCPYVVTIHDLSYFVQPWRCPWLRRKYWYAMTKSTVKVADHIITDSENSLRDLEQFFPASKGRISVVPIAAHGRFKPLEFPRETSGLDQRYGLNGRPYLLYVGTLEPGKNVARIIEAFDRIASEFPEHLLVLAGDKGWLYQPILQAARLAAAADRIILLGHVPDDDVVRLLNFCEAFVFPSLYEGFGLPPLEAMACGAPVIASDTSSLPEVTGDAAVAVDPESVEAIASAMSRILQSAALRQELRERGLKRAASFSWDRAAAETLQAYRNVAGK
jgi:glycosyltransferase involved in cell wall biosynthesis